jgi:hypothetical protein
LNILFTNTILLYGGGEVWMITAMKELIRRNHKVSLICHPNAEISSYAEKNDIDVIKLKMRGGFRSICYSKIDYDFKEKKD